MRVLYLYDLPLPAPVAAPIQILHTTRALADAGHTVVTAWAKVKDPAAALEYYGVAPHPGLSIRPFFSRRTRLLPRGPLRRLARGFDVVMSRGETGVRAFAALATWPDRPAFVYEAHRRTVAVPGLLSGMSGATAAFLEKRAVQGADGVVGISRGILKALAAEYGSDAPTLALPSGVAPPPEGDGPGRDIDVLYAGKIERRKGSDVLLDALEKLPAVRLTLVGDAGGIDLPTGRVDAVGYVEPSRVRDYFRRAKIGLCPLPKGVSEVSDQFTSPMKIMEMMACGTAIVASDLPSVRETLSDGKNALLVPPNDPAALAAAVRRLLDDPELRGRLTAQALADVAAYTWAERGRKLGEFLSAIASRRANGQT